MIFTSQFNPAIGELVHFVEDDNTYVSFYFLRNYELYCFLVLNLCCEFCLCQSSPIPEATKLPTSAAEALKAPKVPIVLDVTSLMDSSNPTSSNKLACPKVIAATTNPPPKAQDYLKVKQSS